jgi:hypothetical protein
MADDNARLLRRPSQQIWIGCMAKADLMGGDDIQVRNAKQEAPQDDLIEILID